MSKAIKLFTVLAILGWSILVLATAQEGDVLLLDGKAYRIYTNPLDPYLQDHPKALPEATVVSTSLWRGYVATWQIEDGRLLLVDVRILKSVRKPGEKDWSSELSSVMSTMFPGQKKILASWFSGHVIVPNGKLVQYVHMGYASTY